jgi:hypothetical protein
MAANHNVSRERAEVRCDEDDLTVLWYAGVNDPLTDTVFGDAEARE